LENEVVADSVPDAVESFRIAFANVLILHPAEERKCRELLHAHRREIFVAEFWRRQCDKVGIHEGRCRDAAFRRVGEYLMATAASGTSCAAAARPGAAMGVGDCELWAHRSLNVVAEDVVALATWPSLLIVRLSFSVLP
jgi:hypothetical protein